MERREENILNSLDDGIATKPTQSNYDVAVFIRKAPGRLITLLSLSFVLVGCATQRVEVPQRPASDVEARFVMGALLPLLDELGYERSGGEARCRVGLTVIKARSINAGTAPGSDAPCIWFTLAVTEGLLARVPLDVLRAMLAHEMGHVRLGHAEARRDHGAVAMFFQRSFYREQEGAADRFAVDLLSKLEPRYPGACTALVYAFSLLAEQPWTSIHPAPDRRAEMALTGCKGSVPAG